MTAQLRSQSYGKSGVRLSQVSRTADRHDFAEICAEISLDGDFDAAYVDGDNRAVIATDTMKNTVYVLANQHGPTPIESFARRLARHFLDAYAHVDTVVVQMEQRPWARMVIDGKEHPHSFIAAGELLWCQAVATRRKTNLQSGLMGLHVLKTTGSGFSDFLRDEFTTLQETGDRLLATTIEASWPCADHQADWTAARQAIRAAMLSVFAEQFSPSVQATLFQMATAAFECCPLIDEISITMPNQHHLPANVAPPGLESDNTTFVPTDEPFGRISATVQRAEAQPHPGERGA